MYCEHLNTKSVPNTVLGILGPCRDMRESAKIPALMELTGYWERQTGLSMSGALSAIRKTRWVQNVGRYTSRGEQEGVCGEIWSEDVNQGKPPGNSIAGRGLREEWVLGRKENNTVAPE